MIKREKNGDGKYKLSLDFSQIISVMVIVGSILTFIYFEDKEKTSEIAENTSCIRENRVEITHNKDAISEYKVSVEKKLETIQDDIKLLLQK